MSKPLTDILAYALQHQECGGGARRQRSTAAGASRSSTPDKRPILFHRQRPEQAAQHSTRTIRHAHARVVDLLPVLERLVHRALAAVVVRVVVVLEVVADEELVLRLRAEDEPEPEAVDEPNIFSCNNTRV